MNACFPLTLAVATTCLIQIATAADPTAEDLLKPTRLTLITTGSDLGPVFADIEKQTSNKLVDETSQFGEQNSLTPWNFSLSDREFWPLLDKFLDAADLEPIGAADDGRLAIGRRQNGMTPRYGKASYIGPFRLEVIRVTSHLGTRMIGDHRSQIQMQVAWEPRLNPLCFSVPAGESHFVDEQTTHVDVSTGSGERQVEMTTDPEITVYIPVNLPKKQLTTIRSLKGRIKALVATRTAEFRFKDLDKVKEAEQSDSGVKLVLSEMRENQDLTELHMRLEFDKTLPNHVSQGSWNFQNTTYLENVAGEKLEHSGFETTSQSDHTLGLAYYFEIPKGKLADYTWVYQCPAAMVELPIEFELKDIPLP